MEEEILIKCIRQQGIPLYTSHELYTTWRMMNYRCYSPVHTNYETYGGAGICVCDEWRWDNPYGFYNFLQDVGQRPEKHTLDRIDPYGSYTKENCRWATKIVQQNNFRTNKRSTTGANGVVLTPEGLYKAQTCVDGLPFNILTTDSFEEACEIVEIVRKYKAEGNQDVKEFAKSLVNISPTGKRLHARKSSKYYGVCWSTRKGMWRATVPYKKDNEGKVRQKHVGYFEDEDEAYKAVLLEIESRG